MGLYDVKCCVEDLTYHTSTCQTGRSGRNLVACLHSNHILRAYSTCPTVSKGGREGRKSTSVLHVHPYSSCSTVSKGGREKRMCTIHYIHTLLVLLFLRRGEGGKKEYCSLHSYSYCSIV